MKPRLQRLTACLALLTGSLAGATAHSSQSSPNVILITIDTVRADHLSCYGDKNIQTPAINTLAHDGIVFDHAISQVPLTWPSHAVILTGTYPFQNGVQDFTGQPLSAQFRSVAQAFKDHGYATGAVVSSFVLDRSWGLARGFDFYDDAFSAEEFSKKDPGLVERRADQSVSHAIAWLQKTRRPFFFWLHLYDPHSPYDPPEPYRAQYRGRLYDGEIAYADHELGRLIAWLKLTQLYQHTAIVLLSDHGESLGEHGEDEHGFFIYNSTIHIPLIVKPPAGSGFRPTRVSKVVQTTAVAPSLLGFARIDDTIKKQFQSSGLFETSSEQDEAAYGETFYPFSSFGWSPLHALETGHYHYIEAPTPELYDLTADPEEKNNLASQQPAIAAVLKDKLENLLKQNLYRPLDAGSPPLSPDTLEKLRSLGYVAYRSPVSSSALAAGLPDPKSKIDEFNAILRAGDAFRAGDYAAGKVLLAQVQREDPTMYIIPFYLGEAALQQEKWEQASADFKKSLDFNPNFDQAMTGLARALSYQGMYDEAKLWAQNALKFNSQNYRAWYELGSIENRANNRTAAIADYQKAVAIQGNFAPLRRDLGFLYFEEKNYAEAANNLAQAVELGMASLQIYNALGTAYTNSNRLPRGIASYQQALKLDPGAADVHLNLGFAYEKFRQKNLAKQQYQQACRLKSALCSLIASHE
ncbi:MAG TPA: sulfatase-like hydrolase/transferase [Terriglobales bacterium]|nr:sulfatase-like hydrolase/transferase [Terriglobales bacterium]